MEKLVYVLWKKPSFSYREFSAALRGEVSTEFLRLGTTKLSVNVVDEHVEAFAGSRMTRFDPAIAGTISFWLDSADDRAEYERVLLSICEQYAGYLVVESVPIVNTTRAVSTGERVPGVNVVACIERPSWIEYDAWLEHWHGHHRKVAVETQSTYLYIRNVVVRPLTENAPPWAGIVEEGFPAEALSDPMVWYDADGSEEKLKENMDRMMASVKAFLEIDRVESNPMSEYIIKA